MLRQELDYLVTEEEHRALLALARDGGPSAAAFRLKRLLGLDPADIRKQLARLDPAIRLSGDAPELAAAYARGIKRGVLFVFLFLVLASLVGVLLLEPEPFVTIWWPACVLLLLAAWLARPAPYGHPGLIMLGIVLIPVSGVVAVAIAPLQDAIPIFGLPLILLCLVCLSFGMAETLFAQRVPPGADRRSAVRRRRLSRRLARIVLASYVLMPILTLNHHLAVIGSLDESSFNALFRYGLFLIVAAPVIAMFCVPLAASLASAVTALLTPIVMGLWLILRGEVSGWSPLIAEAAVVQLLAVYLTVFGGLATLALTTGGRRRLVRAWGLYLLLALGLLLGAGALEILIDVLWSSFPHRGGVDWLIFLILPALLIAASVIGRNDFRLAMVP
jgi:hypothetical protein